MSFGSNLKMELLRRKMTQKHLADEAGIDKGYLSMLINDRISPTEYMVGKISDALELEPDTLLRHEQTMGNWVWKGYSESRQRRTLVCGVCGNRAFGQKGAPIRTPFCPWCGSKMEGADRCQ